ncbi:phosphatidylinositol glycan anchor biosynthesis class N [Rhynchophorus ferrugineus]|uniref:phosphatidylinositol glycan anchor biosynthesis class N n=1 Tax=Rhynchophorus ferrugineus TaxID=354439 RepID=UPI003FCC4DAD
MYFKEKLLVPKNKKYQIIILGLLIHLVMLFAVFDIYFSSPLDHGMESVRSTFDPPAKRLVLFVADGLRAEAVYDGKTERIPFLSRVMKKDGSWGVAHTRVPTESRPGHVALLAGIYEDPSAIMKGWKANPVHFDSVINQSAHAWCWGSPDILNIFNKDARPHIKLQTYDAELEDFGANDTGLLDKWVFDRVRSFLTEDVKKCRKQDCDRFHDSGNVFFLHLLGIDTAGHGFKPHSNQYIDNIRLVDRNTEIIYQLFQDIFNDNNTVFVFTADHGMTDWGSHGAGSSHETEAPFIAWGAGIKTEGAQKDVKQIDIAPLLSSLIGINIPVNSIGVVPLNYLDMNDEGLGEIRLSNTLQLLEIFNVKRERTEKNSLIYLPYKGLSSQELNDKVQHLKRLKLERKFRELKEDCEIFMTTLIEGLDYYHNYYQFPLLMSISLGFIGWILFLAVSILYENITDQQMPGRRTFLYKLNLIPIILCYMQSFPLSYYIHFSFPFLSFTVLHQDISKLRGMFIKLRCVLFSHNIYNILIYFIGLELLVFGFFERKAFSLLTVLIGTWIFFTDSFGRHINDKDKILWAVLWVILSIFPLCPVMKTTFDLPMYVLGSVAWFVLFYVMFCRSKLQNLVGRNTGAYKIFIFQFLCLVLASLYSISLELGFIANSSSVKYFSWCLLFMPVSLIPFSGHQVADRLTTTFFGFAPFYLLVSSNYEALFSAVYVALLCIWLLIESKILQAMDSTNIIYYSTFDTYKSRAKINSDMFRRAFLFIVFIFIGFFGTGNIASLNSFDPMWVRAFLTVFSPFKMMGLILMKITVPFLFSCCVFRAINSIGRENILQMFCIILIFSDLMVLQFLFLITNKGSWLDIGSSLSHFIIMEGFVTILLLLYGFAHIVTTASYKKLVI